MKVIEHKQTIKWVFLTNLIDIQSKEIINVKTKFSNEKLIGYYSDITIVSNLETINNKSKKKLDVSILTRKDFVGADRFNYKDSPNLDGNRRNSEFFAGSGSNIRKPRKVYNKR